MSYFSANQEFDQSLFWPRLKSCLRSLFVGYKTNEILQDSCPGTFQLQATTVNETLATNSCLKTV